MSTSFVEPIKVNFPIKGNRWAMFRAFIAPPGANITIDFEKCPVSWWRMDGLQEKVNKLTEALKILSKWREPDSVQGLKEYDQGLMCGVEDRGFQTNGYDAMRYGYDAALERVAEEIDGTIEAALEEEPPKS